MNLSAHKNPIAEKGVAPQKAIILILPASELFTTEVKKGSGEHSRALVEG
jgi:hypothetical protein